MLEEGIEMAGTCDIDLNLVPGLKQTYQAAIQDIADHINENGGTDKRSMSIIVDFKPDDTGVKTCIKVKISLPNPDVIELEDLWCVRENQTLRLELPKQTSILDNN
jgi:hypothetical protein